MSGKYPAMLEASDGGLINKAKVYPLDESAGVKDFLSDCQQEIISSFSSYTDGIDLARVDNFMDKKGLRRAPVIFIPDGAKPDWNAIVTQVGNSSSTYQLDLSSILFAEDDGGTYLKPIDLAVVARDDELESLNGPGHTERVTVHELAHGARKYQSDIYVNHGGVLAMQPNTAGGFAEEGIAENIAGDYVCEELGLETGMVERVQGKYITYTPVDVTLPVSSVYLFNTPDSVAWSRSAYPATAFDLLTEVQPDLKEKIYGSRQGLGGLAILGTAINTIYPGLFSKMQTMHLGSDTEAMDNYYDFLRAFAGKN